MGDDYLIFGIVPVIGISLIFFGLIEKCISFLHRLLALRQAEKEEEKRAREKIRQKLEEDKVHLGMLSYFFRAFISDGILVSCVLC